jgi:hypothetical protein
MQPVNVDTILAILNQNPVYNRYQNNDFDVGTDNLNPKRQIDANNFDVNTARVQIYIAYKARLDELRLKGLDPSYLKATSFGGERGGQTNADAPSDLGLPYRDKTNITVPISLSDAPPVYGSDVSTKQAVLAMLNSLESLLGSDVMSLGALPIDLCSDRGFGGFASDTGGSGTSAPGFLTTAGDSLNSSAGQPGSLRGNANNEQDALSCLLIELQWLAQILSLLGVVATFMEIERQFMATYWPIISIIVMMAGLWLNPATLEKITQYLAGLATSTLLHILVGLIQEFINSLNLDCLLGASLSVISQVFGTIGVVNTAASDLKSFVDFNNPTKAINQTVQLGSSLIGSFNAQHTAEVQKAFLSGLSAGVGGSLSAGINQASSSGAALVGGAAVAGGSAIAAAGSSLSALQGTVEVGVDTATTVGRVFSGDFQVYQ